MICSKCHVICKEVCPKCGRAKYVREIEENDPVLLMVLTNVQLMFVEPVLTDEKIPYSCIGSMGGAITGYLGYMMETYSIFVPADAYEDAYAKVKEVFTESSDIITALNEFRESV